jgi:hypothetical protein
MPYATNPTYQFKVANRSNAILGDVSGYVLSPVISPRLSVQSMQTWRVPLVPAVLAMSGGDGYPLFQAGMRRLLAYRNGQLVANDLLWRAKPEGGPDSGYLSCEAVGPMIEWTARYAQDANGQIFDGPSSDGTDRGMDLPAGIIATPSMVVTGGELLRQALANTIANDGPLSITLGGPFSTSPIPGGNVAFEMGSLSPLLISELASLLRQAGVCDIVLTPTTAGSAQASVSAVNRAGADLPGVQFSYGTGPNNVAWAYPESSMDDICTKLWYELGLRTGSHFANNVTIDAPGVTVDPTASQALLGIWHKIVQHPVWNGKIPNTHPFFKMYVRRYNAELGLRMWPKTVVRIVPQPGLAPEPWTNYNLGDTPRLDLAQLSIDVSGASFRIIGWDAKPQDDGREQVELLVGWSPQE